MQSYLPLLQTIVGGLLAVIGGVLASLLLQRRSRAHEHRELKRKKLEEVYQYSCLVKASVWQLVVFWATFAVTKANAPSMEDGRSAVESLKLIALVTAGGGEDRLLPGKCQ